ncbi:MAG: hypothetical protein JXB07_13780 [Anaerolineae bacterium]|nr:hypothetical protein [Anaerolineae bacterium]
MLLVLGFGSLGYRDYTAGRNPWKVMSAMILNWFRRTIRGIGQNIDQRVWLVLILVILLAVIVMSVPVESNRPDPVMLQMTMDAASIQTSIPYSTLSVQLTQTPFEAVVAEIAPTLALAGRQEVRQYAAGAEADTERGRIDWGALQAIGAPNTEACSDARTAWSTALPNEQGSLTLYYVQLVRPTAIMIRQTYNPGFITRVALIDVQGEEHVVYEAAPALSFQCPFESVILIQQADYAANAIKITVDQSASAGGWNQIDAVELIGVRYN